MKLSPQHEAILALHKGNLLMRRAEKISTGVQTVPPLESWEEKRIKSLAYFDALPA
jgi:hypothetical protein